MSIEWHQLPKDAGQAVDVKYSIDWENGMLWRRTEDGNDGAVSLEMARILPGEDAFEPWNGVLPKVGKWIRDGGK